jgi:hypothetical protein
MQRARRSAYMSHREWHRPGRGSFPALVARMAAARAGDRTHAHGARLMGRYCKPFNADGIYLMLAGTTLAHSLKTTRVGLPAGLQRYDWGAAYGRDRPGNDG